MKASELRIRNLLEFSNGIQPTKIVTVGRRFFSSASIEKEDGDFEVTPYYKPIPITEEWLVKFGFEKDIDGRTNKEVYVLFDHDSSVLMQSSEVGWCFVWGLSFMGKPIQYVHQLQNLYFALTGEELIFKL